MQERDQFGSRLGMIVTTIGFAVGVGNLWRFPYITGKYGGGIFLLFYLLVVLLIGVPLITIEMSLGSATQKNPVGAYKSLAPNSAWYINGYLHVAAVVLIISYTMPVYAWILNYIFKTALGTFTGMSPEQVGEYFDSFISNKGQVLLWAIVNVILTILVVSRNLQKGVEKFAKILMPALAILIVVLIIKALTLPGAAKGVIFYLKPDWSKFTWEAAFAAIGQAFFSIGIAMSAALVFGSYLRKEDKKLVSNGLIIPLADTLVALLAGFMIFPSVFAFGLEPAQGPGLTFVTMPNVFNNMTGGDLWGTLFYICFYLAAFTSAIAGWESVIAFFKDEFNMNRKKAVYTTLIIVAIITLPSIFSMKFFTIADYIENNFLLTFGALFMTIFVGWVWGIKNFAKEAGIKTRNGLMLWSFLIKYLAPAAIIVLSLNMFGILK